MSNDAPANAERLIKAQSNKKLTRATPISNTAIAAKVIVATPVTGGVYFTEPELRRLFCGYRLLGVDVTSLRALGGATWRAMHVAKRLKVDTTAARALRNRVADHAIYAFAPN